MRSAKVYEVDDCFSAPDPEDFFEVDENKCNLLNYLCEKWCTDEIRVPSSIRIYMGGGFGEETKSVLLTDGFVSSVHQLESSREEADMRIILHAIYSVKEEKAYHSAFQ